jgi:predicted enzyme related to lactoylglutathione lyase
MTAPAAAAIDPSVAFVLLFVDSPANSARFYRHLLDVEPLEQSPTFAMFRLPNGLMLGLWSRATAEPIVQSPAGSAEVAFVAPDVDAVHADWVARDVPMLQAPTDMDFGRTFVALDPDGHRIRVFRPSDAA